MLWCQGAQNIGLSNHKLKSALNKEKGKEEYLYSTVLDTPLTKHSDMITQFYLQITPCLPFLRKRPPDGATPIEVADI